MRRIDRNELQQNIAIQLRVLSGPTKTALQRLRGDQAAEAAAQLIIERCLGGCVVYAPDRLKGWTDYGQTHGKFGQSEPFPPPPPEFGQDRCLICTTNDFDALEYALAESMWKAINPRVAFEDGGEYRTTYLVLAARAINLLNGVLPSKA